MERYDNIVTGARIEFNLNVCAQRRVPCCVWFYADQERNKTIRTNSSISIAIRFVSKIHLSRSSDNQLIKLVCTL